MTDDAASGEPDAGEVAAFWNLARFHAKLNSLPGYFGPTALETVPPPVWSWGESPAEADAWLAELLAAGTAELAAPVDDFDGAALPEVGAMGIVADGTGRPRALVGTNAVEERDGTVVERLAVLWAPDR